MFNQQSITSSLLKGAAGISLMCAANAFAGTTDSYNNMYMSYFSQDNIKALGQYLTKNHGQYQGTMEWEISNDLPLTDSRSLLSTLNTDADFDNKTIVLYWADWDAYLSSHALPATDAPLSSFTSTFNTLSTTAGHPHTVRVLYSFLEAVPKGNKFTGDDKVGTVYFNDPWSDLSTKSCTDGSITDLYGTWDSKGTKDNITCKNSAGLGNYDTFIALPSSIEKYISIGGFGHNNTFEDLFNADGTVNKTYEANFINSLKALVTDGKVAGIDFDYENPNMTHDQAHAYLSLLQDVHTQMPDTKLSIAVLADPEYLQGKRDGSYGFDNLSQFSSVMQSIDLMTYDFHGAFDFASGGTQKTGFLSNVMNNATTAPKFSIDASLNTAETLGVPASKLVIGIPLYARSLANINSGADHTGLGQGVVTGQSLVIPAGDLDTKGCSNDATSSAPCTGTFSYQYLMNHMLGGDKPAFTAKTDYVEGGSTMFADQWQPAQPANYNLEISNLGPATGITVKIGGFSSDYLDPQGGSMPDKTYNNQTSPSASSLEGQTGLVVSWSSYLGTGTCTDKLDLTANMHVMVNADTKVCTISKL